MYQISITFIKLNDLSCIFSTKALNSYSLLRFLTCVHCIYLYIRNSVFFIFIDPCIDNDVIANAEKRSSGYPIDLSKDTPINDVFLSDGWYKVESSIESSMPREAPGPLKCGTWYPIWLNGMLIVSISFSIHNFF